jgi:thiol-disulfide isomerase/thioredoxin
MATVSLNAQENFKVNPAKPVAGSTIEIQFLSRNTELQGKEGVEAIAYLLEGKLPLAKSIALKKEGGVYTGSVKTNDSTKAVFFSFFNDEVKENNKDEGFYTLLYDKNGKVLPGAHLGVAQVYSSFGGIWAMDRNAEKSSEHMKLEFANEASRKKYLNDYLNFLAQSKDEKDLELLRKELEKYEDRKVLTESDLGTIKNVYEYTLKDKEKSDILQTRIKEQFPNGNWKRNEAITAYRQEKNLEKKEKLFNDLNNAYTTFKKDEADFYDQLSSLLAKQMADSGNYAGMKKYASTLNSNTARASLYNSVAWKLAGGGVDKAPVDIKLGKELSQLSMDAIQEEKKILKNKTSYLSDKQYLKNLENSYHSYADTYAVLLFHEGKHDEAYALQQKAMEHYNRKNINLNYIYTVMTEKVRGPKAAQSELESFIEAGHSTPEMKEQLKSIYLASNNTEDQWLGYVGELEQRAFNKLKAEVAKKLINMPAPEFALKNLKGEEVSLASQKGKVVVVDFWATWCGPCISSFPGMQKAVDKYKDNPNVVFLFIDTWESGDDREKKVTDFITKNNYTFNVLYDENREKEGNDFIVVQDFKVDGIPTKFVIDRNSNIRFKSVGYGGNNEALVNELVAMIELADKGD